MNRLSRIMRQSLDERSIDDEPLTDDQAKGLAVRLNAGARKELEA